MINLDNLKGNGQEILYVAWDIGSDLHLAILSVAPSNWGMMSFAIPDTSALILLSSAVISQTV